MADEPGAPPLSWAHVMVNGTEGSVHRSVISDDEGRFAFAQLPAGRYLLSAGKAPYLTTAYGADGPALAGTPIVLAANDRKGDLVLKLPRGAAISGTVRDPFGQPARFQFTSLLREKVTATGRLLVPVPASSAVASNMPGWGPMTDDRGVYRLYGITPGEYVIGVGLRSSDSLGFPFHETTTEDVARAVQLINEPASTRPTIPFAMPAVIPVGAPGATPAIPAGGAGWAPIFYPGTPIASSADRIRVSVGDERLDADVRLSYSRMTTIRAAVHDAAGGVAANTLFHIVSREPLMRSSAAVVRPTSSDGRYEQAVGPGRYTLEAAGMRLGAGTASMPPSSCASADVEVNGQKTIDVDLVLRRCPTLSGRLIFDRAATPLPAIDITITVTPADPAPGSWVAVRTVRAQADRFEIPALPPGRYRLSAGPSQASPRPGEPAWYLATATLGERDVIDAPFDLRADAPVGEITATFNATPSTLKGRLMDASGRSVTGYAVILFSSDSSGWYWRSRRIQVVQTGDDGTFAVVGVPAGEYFLAAVTGLESDDEYDPEWLRRVTVSAIRVFLKAGQDLKQDLRLGPGSPRAPR